jgi:hypothetical protein
MRVMSNAFLWQAEVTQIDRWKYGPLEIHLIPEPTDTKGFTDAAFGGQTVMWNCSQCAGFVRDAKTLEWAQAERLVTDKNPNVVLAPTRCGYSELLGMLGSLLPDEVLGQCGIDRPKSNFWLWPCAESINIRSLSDLKRFSRAELNRREDAHLQRLAAIIPRAFEQWIWQRLVPSKRFRIQDFSRESSLRLLAGDVRFWMHRLYRLAIDLYESTPPTEHEEESWRSLDEIESHLNEVIEESDRQHFQITRPRMGGDLWYPNDPDEREWIADLLIEGDATIESLAPVADVLLSGSTHEDFSDRYSWIKEDFERSFYSKRSKVKVRLFEFLDQCPVHDGSETPGYENILFRDLMAFFNERERTIILALRQGNTQSEIAEQLGHSGHASISRRVKSIEQKMKRLLRNE